MGEVPVMKPMLKYKGGKSKEISHFVKYVPKRYSRYIEPFVGGGALYFYLEPESAIINDVNSRLYRFYAEVRDKYLIVRGQLDALQDEYEDNQRLYERLKSESSDVYIENGNEALYYRMRDAFNHKIDTEYLESVVYFFINKTAYSGMTRYNANGEYNVSFGRYRHFNAKVITDGHRELLGRTDIYNYDYSKIFDMAESDDFVFLDPPYDCLFNDYGNERYRDGFGEDEHRRLANDFENLHCRVLMVINRTPLTEELYGRYVVDEYSKQYAVNIRNRFRYDATHIVVTNY